MSQLGISEFNSRSSKGANPQMKRIYTFLLLCFAFGFILSCAIVPQKQVPESRFLSTELGEQKNIRLHALYKVPRRIPLGPSIPLGVAEGLDAEKVRKSIVQMIDSEGPQGSGFFVAPNKIATAIHVVTGADLDALRVRSGDTDYAVQGVIAYDAQNDLVVLKISGEGIPLVLGNSEAVRSGDTVFSVGYSLDRYNVAKSRVDSLQGRGTCIEVTSHIVPGTSGGPMLNTEGEVIGVNVAGSGFSGYGIVSNALKILLVGSGVPESVGQWEQKDSVRAYVVLGEAHKAFSVGDYAKAIATLNKGMALNPTYSRTYVGTVPTYYNRGYAKMYLGHADFTNGNIAAARHSYQQAIEDLDKALTHNPANIAAYAKRGHAKMYLGHADFTNGNIAAARHSYQQAIEDLDKALTHNQTYPPIYTDRGVTKVFLGLSQASQGLAATALGYYSGAVEDFNKAINFDPADAYTYGYTYGVRGYARICLGYLESSRGNTGAAEALYKAAITDANSALQLNTENPYYYHTRGVAKAALDDCSGAIDDFNKTLSLKSDFARAYYNRALAKAGLGQQNAAKIDFEKARRLGLDVDQ